MIKHTQTDVVRQGKELFFVAVVPPAGIRKEVTKMKIDMAEVFQSSRALRSPPHITLVPPFNYKSNDEKKLFNILTDICSVTTPFDIIMNNFGAFKPRVIYIKISENDSLYALYEKLNRTFNEGKHGGRFNPHMTLAFRDLSKVMFYKAWQKYKSMSFRAEFDVHSLFLLKHNQKHWEIYREFQFGG